MTQPGVTAKSRYAKLEPLRLTFLDRARKCAELTIPSLIPPAGHSASSKFITPSQGLGARGVNNLAAKLLLSLLPPNSPFFRLLVDEFTKDELTQMDDNVRSKVDEALAKIERVVQTEIEAIALRPPMFEGLKHLIVGGNCLIYLPFKGGVRVFSLEKYVVARDPYGNVLEVIVKECVARETLDPDILVLIQTPLGIELPSDSKTPDSEVVDVYTRMYRSGNQFKLYQEIEGHVVPGSEGSYPLDKAPMIPLRWTRIDGEAYGRGHVEEYIGDLISAEFLSKAMNQAAAAMSKIVFLVAPNGVTKATNVAKAESGDFIVGQPQDIATVQADKAADMRVPAEQLRHIEERISFAFLLNSSVQRQAERVTAEEIRFMAGEIEDTLGGVYSLLSQELQLPLVNCLMARLTRQKRLPPLPKGTVKPAVVTGVEALGRGHDLNKYNLFLQSISVLGPEVIANVLKANDFISRIGTAVGIDMKGLVKTQEELQAEQMQMQEQAQQQQMADMVKSGVPNATKAVADAVVQNQE